jgi:preprotein translocase subunit SecA
MSRATILAAPGQLASGRPYAERAEREPGWHDRLAESLLAAVKPASDRLRNPARGLERIVGYAGRHDQAMRAATDSDLAMRARSMGARLRREGFVPALVGECFALVREAASRTIGQRHYDPQLMCGWALLHGRLVEMETGEGKTIAASLAASTAALAGCPVHVVTVNDYLVGRDAELMGPLYRFLGLSVGTVVQGMTPAARRQAYARSITYCSNKELAFDYLRDRVALSHRTSRLHLSLEKLRGGGPRDEKLVLRGLYFGIVDEADSIFIDEARTPLILSTKTGSTEEKDQCEQALQLAQRLTANEDYAIDPAERSITLTQAGRAKLAELADDLCGVWTSVSAREELVTQALSAVILFRRDQHYVVADGKVQIVDESTGRIMADRSWERGLHQLIEVKEGLDPTDRRETLARLTYQRLFRRYIRLAGMTGTASEVGRELRSIYGLDVVRIPLHRPSRRAYFAPQVCITRAEKWGKVAERVERLSVAGGRPVLIGTRSVHASEEISAVLHGRGIAHALLNAKQDQEEAHIVALAGQPSQVTVATNMAGRGTDIQLGEGVAQMGGLHVILTEYHESRRVDRQFFGRCARQGDSGSCEAIVSLDDELYAHFAPAATRLVNALCRRDVKLPVLVYEALRRLAQIRAERHGVYLRVQNLMLDRRLDRVLAFSGRRE